MLNSDMPYNSIQLEGQTEDVVLIGAVTNNKRSAWLSFQQLLRHLTADRAPVPTTLQTK